MVCFTGVLRWGKKVKGKEVEVRLIWWNQLNGMPLRRGLGPSHNPQMKQFNSPALFIDSFVGLLQSQLMKSFFHFNQTFHLLIFIQELFHFTAIIAALRHGSAGQSLLFFNFTQTNHSFKSKDWFKFIYCLVSLFVKFSLLFPSFNS